MRISDWSSDVCSSDLPTGQTRHSGGPESFGTVRPERHVSAWSETRPCSRACPAHCPAEAAPRHGANARCGGYPVQPASWGHSAACPPRATRSEEHTSELQSLMRNSYAVFCLKKKKTNT